MVKHQNIRKTGLMSKVATPPVKSCFVSEILPNDQKDKLTEILQKVAGVKVSFEYDSKQFVDLVHVLEDDVHKGKEGVMIVSINQVFVLSSKLEFVRTIALKDIKIAVLHQLDHSILVINSIGQPDLLLKM